MHTYMNTDTPIWHLYMHIYVYMYMTCTIIYSFYISICVGFSTVWFSRNFSFFVVVLMYIKMYFKTTVTVQHSTGSRTRQHQCLITNNSKTNLTMGIKAT